MTFATTPITVQIIKVNASARKLNATWSSVEPDEIGVMKTKVNYESSKYKFSRSKWFEADMWGHSQVSEIRNWCIEQFGPLDKDQNAWSRWTNKYSSSFKFRDEADYVLFVLRWGA